MPSDLPSEVVVVRSSRVLSVALGSSFLLVTTALPAGAYSFGAGTPVAASAAVSPFVGCTIGAGPFDPPSVNYPNTEVEPFVAVNPTDADNLIGVFQEDRWSDGGAHGLVAAYSLDGGNTWRESWARFSACAGGEFAPSSPTTWTPMRNCRSAASSNDWMWSPRALRVTNTYVER